MPNFTAPDLVGFPNSKTGKAVLEGRSRLITQIGTASQDVEGTASTAIVGGVDVNTGNTVTSFAVTGIGGGSTIVTTTQVLVANSIGQTAFTLGGTPTNPAATLFYVNTVQYTYGTDFTVSGNVLTWMGSFNLAPTDVLKVVWY